MGFLQGRVTCVRFRVSGNSVDMFGPEHLAALEDAMIGKQRVMSGDGSQFGWSAGDHILDTRFDLAKNVINDALHFAMRVDENKMPADTLRAYALVELEALAAGNPSGHPSAKQKREARQTAKDRLEQEARDGRFIRRKAHPILWDNRTNTLLVGTAPSGVLGRLHSLFKQTFNRTLEFQGAGALAYRSDNLAGEIDNATPSVFVHGGASDIAWIADEGDRNFLGNEFLVWLWYVIENETDTFKVGDGSEVAVMLARTLTLECPKGMYGSDTFRSDGPTKLPEAMRALRGGRLPRKAGLTIVRHDHAYELTLQAETFAISGAKMPALENSEERARKEERIDQIRHFLETADLLYGAFLTHRIKATWGPYRGKISAWLREKPEEAAA